MTKTLRSTFVHVALANYVAILKLNAWIECICTCV